jgi:type VI secretion system protein ImpE
MKPMLAEQSLSQGNTQDALAQLQISVRKDPSNPKLRIFLFQLLAVLGQWERALAQLIVSGELDTANLLMVQTYREAISCELLRKEIFNGAIRPLIFGDPVRWLALSLEALKLTALGQNQHACELRAQAFELAPATSGSIDGQVFDWIADADARLGPVLEAIVNGNYYWIPFHQINVIHIEVPSDLRDMVWTPAHFRWVNGGEAFGLIPTRYPGSEYTDDPSIQLARKTEWQDQGDNTFIGYGQRLLTTNENEYALLDIREINFSSN